MMFLIPQSVAQMIQMILSLVMKIHVLVSAESSRYVHECLHIIYALFIADNQITLAWTQWENQGVCSVKCGTGDQTRTRRCVDPSTNGNVDASECGPESASDTQPCTMTPKPGTLIQY